MNGEILNYVVPALATAIVGALGVIAKAFWDWLRTKTHNEKLDKYIDMADDAVFTAVAEVAQTFVTTLKNSGEWNEESAKKAFELAKMKAVEIMGAAALKALPEVVGDFDAWLRAKIEAATLETKALTALAPQMCVGGSDA